MKRLCREPVAARPTQSALRELLPHLRIITDPATLARLNAEAGKRRSGKMRKLNVVPQPDLDYC
jgi:hypothetical protein